MANDNDIPRGDDPLPYLISEKIRDRTVSVKLTPEEKILLEQKAKQAGIGLSDWLRYITLEAPAYDPEKSTLGEAVLEEILTRHSTEQAKQYKHFLQVIEELLSKLKTQLQTEMQSLRTEFQRELKDSERVAIAANKAAFDFRESVKTLRRSFRDWILAMCGIAVLTGWASGMLVERWSLTALLNGFDAQVEHSTKEIQLQLEQIRAQAQPTKPKVGK